MKKGHGQNGFKMSCSHCFKTKDIDGKPVSHCTGMCKVIYLGENKETRQKQKVFFFGSRYASQQPRIRQ